MCVIERRKHLAFRNPSVIICNAAIHAPQGATQYTLYMCLNAAYCILNMKSYILKVYFNSVEFTYITYECHYVFENGSKAELCILMTVLRLQQNTLCANLAAHQESLFYS